MENLLEIKKLSCAENKKRLKSEFNKALKDNKKAKMIGSFILTDKAISRLYKLESNLLAKNHVLIEAPTGSSKTKTV